MKLKFDVSLDEYKIINAILNEHLAPRCLVFVFGSRAKNTARFNSDLDLAIASDKPLTQKETVMLKDAFNESRLPYKVDVVDMHNIEKSFRDIIDSQKVRFPLSRSLSHSLSRSLSRSLSGVEGKGNVPELRFPEFSGEWVAKRLGEIIDAKSKKIDSKSNAITYKCIDLEHLSQETGMLLGYVEASNLGSSKNVFSKGDVLFGKLRPYLRKYIIAPFDGVCSSEILVLKGIGIVNGFLYFIIQTNNFISLANKSTGSKMPRADWKVIELNPVFIPSLPEQQKIADFLTSVDNKIQSLTQKKEALNRYKKGLLQKLFPKDGESVPELRFPGFSGEWVEKRLGEVANFLKGKGISKTDIVQNGALECVRYGELYTHYDEVITDIRSKTNLGMDELVLSNANDVIIPASGESQLDIAKASCITKSGVALGGDLNIIRSKNSGVFLSYYLNGIKKIEIARLSQGISVIHLYSSQLKTLTLNFPSLPEQQKIADFLTEVDNKITKVEKQIANMNQFKKGLLQQMFV